MIKKDNQFESFKFGDVQLLDILSFFGGATSLDSFLKAYKTSETKLYSACDCLNNPEIFNITQLLSYETFVTNQRINNLLEKDYSDFQILMNGGLTSKEDLSKLKLKQPPATGQKNYQYLTSVWQQENM